MKRKRADRRGQRGPWGSPKELTNWGTKGGEKTKRKYGNRHFREIIESRNERIRRTGKKFPGGRPKGAKDSRPRKPRARKAT